MAVKLGALIKSLATKMNLKLDDEKLKPLFELDTEVDDAINTAFEQNLMTESAALSNTKIRNTIKAESLNGLDAVLDELMGEYEFDDTLKADMKKADTSFKRTKLVAAKIAELKEKKAAAGLGEDKKAIQKKIDELNQAMVDLKKTAGEEKENLIKAHDAEIMNMGLEGKLLTKKYFSDDIPASVHAITARALVEQNLAKSGAKLVYDKAAKSFKLLTADTGTDYHDANNKKITVDDFIDGVLAENKLLKTTPGGPNPDPNQPIITPGGDTKNQIPDMLSTIDQQLGSA